MAAVKDTEAKKYQAEGDLSTLIEAAKIKNDKKRMKAAMACKMERMKALEEVGDSSHSMKKEMGEDY